MMFRLLAPIALILLLSAAATAQAPASAELRGRVVAEDGRAVTGAQVTAVYLPTAASAAALSDERGEFRIAGLRAGGPYEVRVVAAGFHPLLYTSLQLGAGEVRDLDLVVGDGVIPIGEVEVTVRAGDTFAQTRTGSALLLDRTTVDALPTLSRNYLDLARLSPMVRVAGSDISVAGQNHRYNRQHIDGVVGQDGFGRELATMAGVRDLPKPLPIGAIDQFQVLVAPYDVRSSGFTGGLLNAVTRSGSNRWSGSAAAHVRDQRLIGDGRLDGAAAAPGPSSRQVIALDLGGPIRRDRVHLFGALEVERRRNPVPGFSLGAVEPERTGIAPDSARRLATILRDAYGMDPGTGGVIAIENPIANAFVRLDARLTERHRLTSWVNHGASSFDLGPDRDATGPYEFASSASRFATRTDGGMAQLVSRFRGGLVNELTVGVQRIHDRHTPGAVGPQVEVDVVSAFEGSFARRRLRAGPRFLGQASEVRQRTVQLTNQLGARFGDHGVALGVHVEHHAVRTSGVQGSQGAYRFATLEALEANLPDRYQVHLLEPGVDPEVRFRAWQIGVYLQDEWRVGRGLVIHLGARADVWALPDRPAENQLLREVLDVSTSGWPRPAPVLSPRLGFNWQDPRTGATQIRGGAGLFAGAIPFAWLADARANTGLRSRFVTCGTRVVNMQTVHDAPPLDPSGPTPESCLAGGTTSRSVTALDRGLRMPRDLRVSLGLDRRLPYDLVLSLEGMYTRALSQVAVEDANLGPPVEDPDAGAGYSPGFGNRPYFGEPTVEGFAARRISDAYGPVLLVTNGSGDYSYTMAGELRRISATGLELRAGYAYTRSFDRQSLIGLNASSNFGDTPIERDPNRPVLAPSHFDRPHKVTASAVRAVAWRAGESRVALLYEGQSGGRYSYVYGSDVNGDGQPGPGWAEGSWNDLLHVHARPSDLPGGFAAAAFMEQLIAQEPCLHMVRGSILWRNSCRLPWSNRLDMEVTHALGVGSRTVRLAATMRNALNLMNPRWGSEYHAAPTVPVLEIVGRDQQGLLPSPRDPLVVAYTGPVRRDRERGGVIAALPHQLATPDSRWQAQVGLEIAW
jgi:hypothetical protein